MFLVYRITLKRGSAETERDTLDLLSLWELRRRVPISFLSNNLACRTVYCIQLRIMELSQYLVYLPLNLVNLSFDLGILTWKVVRPIKRSCILSLSNLSFLTGYLVST